MSEQHAPRPPWAVTSIVLSMGLIALGNGILFAYVPLKLAESGFPPWVAGAVITALGAGGLAGCLVVGHIVQRVGHARAFGSMAAMISLSILMITLAVDPYLWVVSRALYGFAASGLFIVTQSWLNDASENEWRGRVIAIFYMTYVVCIGIGSYLLTFISLDGLQAPLLGVFFTTIAMFPVGLTRLRTPPPPEFASIAIKSTWKISPVGLAGLLAVGGLTMAVQGFAPIYAAAENYSKEDVALLLFLMQFGMIGVQMPLGAISDRMDRRFVLVAASLIVIVSAAVATQMSGASLIWLILVFGIWAGATESIYAVANAHANDRADPQYYVSLSSTLLIAWSVSGLIIPALTTALTPVVGPRAFMFVAIAIAVVYGAFVLYRMTRREAPAEDETAPYQPITAQAPHTPELAPQATEE